MFQALYVLTFLFTSVYANRFNVKNAHLKWQNAGSGTKKIVMTWMPVDATTNKCPERPMDDFSAGFDVDITLQGAPIYDETITWSLTCGFSCQCRYVTPKSFPAGMKHNLPITFEVTMHLKGYQSKTFSLTTHTSTKEAMEPEMLLSSLVSSNVTAVNTSKH